MAKEITLTMDGMLLNWLKTVGQTVSSGEVIAEVEADKATVEVQAPGSGVIMELRAQIGDELKEGAIIGLLGEEGETPLPHEEKDAVPEGVLPPADEQPAASAGAPAARTPTGRIKASPIARKIADEKGIDLALVAGSGPQGRIVKADVESFDPSKVRVIPQGDAAVVRGMQPTYGKLPVSDDVEIVDVPRMRQRIAENTSISKQEIPHFYVTMEMDVAPLLALRKELNARLADEGIKISVNDMIVKAVALTLRKFPNLNTHYYGDKLVIHKRVNIGIAVALPDNGLINVVSQDADKTALSVMAANHKAMFDRARENRLRPEDLKGSTFTISNLGPYGVEDFIAIISPPEAGILAVSSTRRVPVVLEDGSLGVGDRMKATISVDHRVSDGAEGAQFMQTLRSLIENPMRLLV